MLGPPARDQRHLSTILLGPPQRCRRGRPVRGLARTEGAIAIATLASAFFFCCLCYYQQCTVNKQSSGIPTNNYIATSAEKWEYPLRSQTNSNLSNFDCSIRHFKEGHSSTDQQTKPCADNNGGTSSYVIDRWLGYVLCILGLSWAKSQGQERGSKYEESNAQVGNRRRPRRNKPTLPARACEPVRPRWALQARRCQTCRPPRLKCRKQVQKLRNNRILLRMMAGVRSKP